MSDPYVSPVGSDDAAGTTAAPFRAIERARDTRKAPFTITGTATEGGRSFEEWKAAGHHRHPMVADPGFRALETKGFAVPRGSAAEAIAHVSFEFRDGGSRTE
jgi:hypothetical protein